MTPPLPCSTAPSDATLAGLREEANTVKQCFTNFSFQALLFAAAVLGAIAAYGKDYPLLYLSSVFVAMLILSVARIGTYKYATANRIYGYELHLARLRHVPVGTGLAEVHGRIAEVSWEEAMRAWRVVQATAFRQIFWSGMLVPNIRRRRRGTSDYDWFEPGTIVGKVVGAAYHAGSYLSTMLAVLYLFLLGALVPLWAFLLKAGEPVTGQRHGHWSPMWAGAILFSLFCLYNVFVIDVRRRLVERGFLCIHTCSIMWEATVVAHLEAVRLALKNHNSMRGYTLELATLARDLANNLDGIHEWTSVRKAALARDASRSP